MKTAHDILADEALGRLRRDQEQSDWDNLVRYSRYPRGQVPFMAQMILAPLLVVIFSMVGLPGDHRSFLVVGAGLLFVAIVVHVYYLRRKSRALVSLIQQHAPDLHQRLRRENVT